MGAGQRNGLSCYGIVSLLETPCVGFLGTSKSLEPLGDLFKALFTRGACKAWIHLGVFVGLACDRCLEVSRRIANRKSGSWITAFRKEFHVAERMACLAFGRIAKYTCYVCISFDICLACEVEISAIRLGFARKSFLQILERLSTFKIWHCCLL